MKKFRKKRDLGPRVNERIRVREVRLIDENGTQVGIVPIQEALERAKQAGLDLVEVAPNAKPPVCRILDYGKYKYEMEKKEKQARKKLRQSQIKEMQFRPRISEHDLEVKVKKVREFLEEGHKVRVRMRLRGREMAKLDEAMQIVHRIAEMLSDVSKVDSKPKQEGMQILMILAPNTK